MKSETEKSGRFLIVAICFLLLISTAQGAWDNDDLMYAKGTSGGQLTVHNIDTEKDFETIQDAIDDPDTKDGHTISVDAGNYPKPGTDPKPVVINKQLKLIGENKDTTIIDGYGSVVNCIEVTADNVEICGFTIKNGDYGIRLESSNCRVIDNNIASIDFDGIFLTNSVNITIAHNSISEVKRRGIRLSSSCNNRIHDNDLSENEEGIVLFASPDNSIYHNNFIDNRKQAKDNRNTNRWDNGPEEGGNYWSDHKCTGNPSNGSQPYDISIRGATDNYPFMNREGWTCTLPSPPALADPGTNDNDGNYTVSWSSVTSATNYTLEEDTSSSFSSPTKIYSGPERSKEISGKSEGTYYYQVKACNACGCSEWSNRENITIDTIPPTVTISYPASRQTFGTTNITVKGTASDNVAMSKVEVKVGSGDWQRASGTTSWNRSVTLARGPNTINASATDTAGNTKNTSVTVICDITPPVIYHENITTANEGESIPISATITDDTNVASATLFYRNTTGEEVWIRTPMDHVGDNHSATIPASDVTTAGVEYYIEAVDDASNTAYSPATAPTTPYSITVITIDTIPPTVNITYPTNEQTFGTTTITVNGNASDNVAVGKVEVKVGSKKWQTALGTTSWNKSVTLAIGPNTIYARATDTSGNTKNTSVTVFCDITPPVITHEPITNATEGENISIFAKITDDTEVISAISYRITGEGAWISIPMIHIGDNYSATIPASNVTTAGVDYYIEAVDDVSNTAYKPATAPTTPYRITVITIDTIPPTVNITYPTNRETFNTTTITVKGTASDNVAVDKVDVKVGSESWQTASGTTSWNTSVTLAPGSNTIYASATDTSNNTKNTSVRVICDITPPDIYHENITTATEGEAIPISATITDDTTKVASATLFYSISGEEAWTSTPMIPTGNIYSETIHASHVTTAGVEYYIEAVDDASNIATSLATAPEKPYLITVKVNVGYAIIIAGRTDDDKGRTAINLSAKNTYGILLKQGFTNESIFYLNPGMKQDVDGDSKSDVNRMSSRANIEYAINTWAQGNVSVNVPLFIYMVGHCKNDKFIVNGAKEELTASDLNNYLDHLNDKKCQNITVVYEAGNSGCFIDDLSGTGRIIVTSTGVDADSLPDVEKGGVFSYYFFNSINAGNTIKGAFETASNSSEIKAYSKHLKGMGKPPQTPLLDDNGDGKGHNISQIGREGSLAGSRYIGKQGGCP